MLSPGCVWLMGDERLADLGALLVFRHWLRGQLEELAGESQPLPEQACERGEEPYGRLFF